MRACKPAFKRVWGTAGKICLSMACLGLVAEAAPGRSVDAGCVPVSVHCGAAPSVAVAPDGGLWTVFEQGGRVWVATAPDGARFGPAVAVYPEPEEIETNGENRPKIVFGRGAVFVSWTRRLPRRFTGEIRFTRSLDGGKTFDPPRTVNDDGLAIGHRFDSLAVDSLGHVYLAWIDKRDLEAAKEEREPYVGAALYYTVSADQGETFSANRRVAHHACECCRIALVPVPGGGVVAFWRHVFAGGIRDHALAVLGLEGVRRGARRATWEGWELDGCPHHGGSLAVGRDGYHLAWFTGAKGEPEVRYGRFDPGSGELHDEFVAGRSAVAHPFILEWEGRVWLVWKERLEASTVVYLKESLNAGRSWSPKRSLASTAGGSDHPFLLRSSDQPLLVWQTQGEGLVLRPL